MWGVLLTCAILGYTVSAGPIDEFGQYVQESETQHDDVPSPVLSRIMPVGFITQSVSSPEKKGTADPSDYEDLPYFKEFMTLFKKGFTSKSVTFNIFDDDIRETTITLYKLLSKIIDKTAFDSFVVWASNNINLDMYNYIKALLIIHDKKFPDDELVPAFIHKPNYFINSETIFKALQFHVNNEDPENSNEIYKDNIDNNAHILFINTNYSNWNVLEDTCTDGLNYFREDIGLNNYYYHLHLQYPFWMTDQELNNIDEKHAERYYYAHQQLVARYLLENQNDKTKYNTEKCYYHPQLVYDNGLAFPIRPMKENSDENFFLHSVNIAINECIKRGIVFTDGSVVNISASNHNALFAKFVRMNLENPKTAKITRDVYGYGDVDLIPRFNPSPSVLHHHMTSLRDPLYWSLIRKALHYFTKYKRRMQPLDLSFYENNGIIIQDAWIPNLMTRFCTFSFSIEKALHLPYDRLMQSKMSLHAKQRRLCHKEFSLSFHVFAKYDQNVSIYLFLGPNCKIPDCLKNNYDEFFELSKWNATLSQGEHIIRWSPDVFEDNFNGNTSLFFPRSLTIPHGLKNGRNLQLFVMLTNVNVEKPLGFPFHLPSTGFKSTAPNYRIFNVTVFHTD